MPTLPLGGGFTPGAMAYAEAFRTLLPSAEVDILKRRGHLPQLERRDVFLESIKKFFRD